jgi:hypothetical protein
VSEIARAWHGAWRLAHADPGGLAYFDDSTDAFWRSFRAAVIIAPGHVALIALHYYVIEPLPVTWPHLALVQLIAYVVSWVAYPVAMHAVCRAASREAQFIRYIVAYNWSALLQMAVYLGAVLIATSGTLGGAGSFLVSAAIIVLLLYSWLIARIALQVGPLLASGIVLLDFVLGYVIQAFAEWTLA